MLAPMTLAACSAPVAETPRGLDAYPEHGVTAGKTCRAPDPARFVGRAATAALGTEARDAAGAASVRWIRHDSQVTMDYRTDRLNVRLDARNMVVGLSCG
jgi:hypothetical protein